MEQNEQTDHVLQQLIEWAEKQEPIRAMLLTSTRAVPQAHLDVFSDYDVILVVTDIHPFVEDKSWLQDFGEVLVVYWDSVYAVPDYPEYQQSGNVTQYADGLKIDFTLWPLELMQRIAQEPMLPEELDAGCEILLDKDKLTKGMKPPSYSAYIPARPTNETYQTHINDFFSDAPYVAKCLWRDELLPAKWCLDYDMKHVYLRPMLEWRVECDHQWSMKVSNLGKGLKKQLPPDLWNELESCYAGANIEENWEALFRTMALFRRVAIEVGDHLGYAYPHDLDRRVTAYVSKMKITSRED